MNFYLRNSALEGTKLPHKSIQNPSLFKNKTVKPKHTNIKLYK